MLPRNRPPRSLLEWGRPNDIRSRAVSTTDDRSAGGDWRSSSLASVTRVRRVHVLAAGTVDRPAFARVGLLRASARSRRSGYGRVGGRGDMSEDKPTRVSSGLGGER
jgi:hypothetical protein